MAMMPDAVEPQQPARDRARHCVEDDIHPRRGQVAAQAAGELADGELQSQGEQQQYHADGRARADEFAGGRHRRHATFAKCQACRPDRAESATARIGARPSPAR